MQPAVPTSNSDPESPANKRCSGSDFCDVFYDGTTIIISIADVVTDIMVLISYYNNSRMEFFWISAVILFIAQCGYLILFATKFELDGLFGKMARLLERLCCDCRLCDWFFNLSCWPSCDNLCCMAIIYFLFGLIGVIFFSLFLAVVLPFGHLVSFLMYFAESSNSFDQWLEDKLGIRKRDGIPLQSHLSDMAKFAVKKFNKHGGFMLEAFVEALPQSILQLVAMVVYQETNFIAVGSILLSMTSIMTKSLIISQGIDWKSYLFCWLCVCTDFFGIFFVVSWVFLSNDHLTGNFLGYFNVLGEIWCWKVVIAILLPPVLVALGYIFVWMWLLVSDIWNETQVDWRVRVLRILLFLTAGNVLALIAFSVLTLLCCVLAEIMCFSIVALLVVTVLTSDRWDYTQQKVADALKFIINFIAAARRSDGKYVKNDRIIRTLAVNHAYFQVFGQASHILNKFIIDATDNDRLHTITHAQIYQNCRDMTNYKKKDENEVKMEIAGRPADTVVEIVTQQGTDPTDPTQTAAEGDEGERATGADAAAAGGAAAANQTNADAAEEKNCCDGLQICCADCRTCCSSMWRELTQDGLEIALARIAYLVMGVVCLPIYFLSRLVTLSYPYVIIGYVWYNALWTKLNLFEIVMLGVYVFLQLIIIVLGFFVLRTHYWLWYVLPGMMRKDMHWRTSQLPQFERNVKGFYQTVQWIPHVKEIVCAKFGNDIGNIIVGYCRYTDQEY